MPKYKTLRKLPRNKIIKAYYDAHKDDETLDEIGSHWDISGERVRQIVNTPSSYGGTEPVEHPRAR